MKSKIGHKKRSENISENKPIFTIVPKNGLLYTNIKGGNSIINDNMWRKRTIQKIKKKRLAVESPPVNKLLLDIQFWTLFIMENFHLEKSIYWIKKDERIYNKKDKEIIN